MGEDMNKEIANFTPLEIGDIVTGTVSKIEEKHALIDVNYKIEGVLPISELSNLHIEEISDVLSEDDTLEVKVIKSDDDELVLSKKAVDAEKAWEELEPKFENNETFDVEINDVVKGGLVADLGVRGFIPASLVETYYVEDFSDYKGKTLSVKIIEFEPENNKLILSHRAVLEEELKHQKEEELQNLQPGEIKKGTVQRITDFGAFVNIGAIDGLVHISQLAHHHVETPDEVVTEGEEVTVKVLAVDIENERISLSIKETLPGPWEQVSEKFNVGDVVNGTIKRLVSFGAFVEISPGIEGLVHISEIAHRHIETPGEVLEENEEIEVKILDIDPEAKRVSLSIKALEEETKPETSEESAVEDATESSSTGFSVGDMIGEQLKKYK